MMEALFIKILNMSITAGWLVIAVVLIRFLLKKAPKKFTCLLWAFVAVRLIFPFSLESVFSVLPTKETIPQNITISGTPSVDSGITAFNEAINPMIAKTLAPTEAASVNPMQIITEVASIVWISGMAIMLVYAVISYLKIFKKVREAMPLKENVFICDRISTPFIFGMIKPKIYIPSSVSPEDAELVTAHERAHLRRLDHIWKPLGFLLLTVYWFNPLLWLGYILLCRDIETACDEKVLSEASEDIRASYSAALLNCSSAQKIITACPVAFGETGVKERIKTVLSFKKPAVWIIIAAVIICAVTCVCLLTDPVSSDVINGSTPELESAVASVLLSEADDRYAECPAEGHVIFGYEEKDGVTKAYCYACIEGYGFENNNFVVVTGAWLPAVISFETSSDGYDLLEIKYPRDGSYNLKSTKALFPKKYHSLVLGLPEEYINQMSVQTHKYAAKYLNDIGRKAEIGDIHDFEYVYLSDLGISAEVSNAINDYIVLQNYPYFIGTSEKLVNGERKVYSVAYKTGDKYIAFSTYTAGSGSADEIYFVDAKTGDLYNSSYELLEKNPELIDPESSNTSGVSSSKTPTTIAYTVGASEPVVVSDPRKPVDEQQKAKLKATFEASKSATDKFVDCVLMSGSNDIFGAVLFIEGSSDTPQVKFFLYDGTNRQCGTTNNLAEKPNLTYLGGNTISFDFVDKHSATFRRSVTLSMDNEGYIFKTRDNPIYDDEPEKIFVIYGTVTEISSKTLTLEADKNSGVSGLVEISTEMLDPKSLVGIKTGDRVGITYDGEILETYPCRIPNPYSISKEVD